MIFRQHWYYSQASYKDDHELLGYQPCEKGEGRDVNNDNVTNFFRKYHIIISLS